MVLEYCPGGDLGQMLRRERYFDENRSKLYVAQVLLAIEYLHEKDIIYRDLKPDNIVIDDSGNARLTDFGLSKEGIKKVDTGANSFCGSIAYLSPEMIKKMGHGKSVDWYLLGVLLYECVTGKTPYLSDNKE
jgi:serine/threonine protein kinase